MRVTLVRHAEVEEKYIGCYNGHIDIGLSDKGYADAKALSKHFKASEFDSIFCSDLKRAKETLREFINSKDVIYTKELREKSWGKHEGLSFDEICKQDDLKYINFEQWTDALDGESIQAFTSRVNNFFFKYLPSLDATNILVVTHSGVIKTFIHLLEGISLEDAFGISVPYSSHLVYNSKTKKLDVYD
nr:histidine phosphatase family protein [uncultured Sulfurimonas sp.]